MSLKKQEVPINDFIATGTKTPSEGTAKRNMLKIAKQLNTRSLIWLLVKRHRVGLLATGNIIALVNWAFPGWIELIKSVI